MAKRLTDKQRKAIIADYVISQNYRETARKYKVSASTVKRLVVADPQMVQKSAQKKEQNTADILSYMETKKDKVCKIMDVYLDALLDEEKIAGATTSQLTTALGTLLDKFALMERKTNSEDTLAKARELLEGIDCVIE